MIVQQGFYGTLSLIYQAIINWKKVKKIFKEINGLLFNKLPIYEEIKNITIVDFPLKSGKNARILDREYWLTNDKQTINLDKNPPMEVYAHGYVLLVNRDFIGQSVEDFFNECIKKEWLITSNVITSEQAEELKTAVAFCNAYQNYFLINELTLPIEQIWQNIDYFSTRLPKLDTLRFTDLEQGMWEFYVPKNAPDEHYQEASSENSVRARNPELDIYQPNLKTTAQPHKIKEQLINTIQPPILS